MIAKARYDVFKKNLEPGDVLVTFNTENRLSKVIARTTNSTWSHVAMYIGNGFIIESSVGGVSIRPYKKYMDTKYNVAFLRIKGLTKQQRAELAKQTLTLVDKKYGYLQLFWYLFVRLIGKSEDPKWQKDLQPRKMVCSEAIATAMAMMKLEVKKGFKPSGVEPVDFIQSDRFERIW